MQTKKKKAWCSWNLVRSSADSSGKAVYNPLSSTVTKLSPVLLIDVRTFSQREKVLAAF